jgi:hypothetical protein
MEFKAIVSPVTCILPLMRLMQRSVLWDLGLGDSFFRSDTVTTFQQSDESEADAMVTAML